VYLINNISVVQADFNYINVNRLKFINLTFVYSCIVSVNVNDDRQDATIFAYLFIPSQFYMFRATSSPIIRSTWLYLQLLILSIDIDVGWRHG